RPDLVIELRACAGRRGRSPLSGAASVRRLDDLPSSCQRDIARARSRVGLKFPSQRRGSMATCRPLSAASIAVCALGVFVLGCQSKPPADHDHAQTPAPAAQPAVGQYPVMAPLEEYLMADRDAEIALARSAAPAAISNDATILVLTRQGFQTAVEGKNGFVCIVGRAWTSPFTDPEFWNPKKRGPECMNAPAARSVFP